MDGQIKFCQLLTVSKMRMIGYWLLRVTTPESATESLWPLANQTAEVSPVQLNQSVAQGRTPRWQIYWYNPKTGPSPDWQMTSDFITIFNVNSSLGFHYWIVVVYALRPGNGSMFNEVIRMFVFGKHIQSSEIEAAYRCSDEVNKQHTTDIQIWYTHIFKSNTTVWGILFVRQYALVPSPN